MSSLEIKVQDAVAYLGSQKEMMHRAERYSALNDHISDAPVRGSGKSSGQPNKYILAHRNLLLKLQVDKHTAQTPAMDATIPPEIIIGRIPLVDLKSMPLRAPATMVFAASFLPRR
jgi:hypothetical protein